MTKTEINKPVLFITDSSGSTGAFFVLFAALMTRSLNYFFSHHADLAHFGLLIEVTFSLYHFTTCFANVSNDLSKSAASKRLEWNQISALRGIKSKFHLGTGGKKSIQECRLYFSAAFA